MDLNGYIRFDNHVKSGNVEVFFRNQKEVLLDLIRAHEVIVGAVAWITDTDVLAELARRQTLLVIQKEDFLRPDMETRLSEEARNRLLKAYSEFKPFDATKLAAGPFTQAGDASVSRLPPILCFGRCVPGKMYMTPRMHNKFFVFFEKDDELYRPASVWTGSLNITQLNLMSLENSVLIRDELVAGAYAEEAQIIYLNGEPLDWKQKWINPFLIGKNH